VYNYQLHQHINKILKQHHLDIAGIDNPFYIRVMAGADSLHQLYSEIYGDRANATELFDALIGVIIQAYLDRSQIQKDKDEVKAEKNGWFLSNEITGMSLYVDRFCGDIKTLGNKLDYIEQLGVNLLHLMPLFESPEGESDGGYAVSNFRKVDKRFGTLDDLLALRQQLDERQMYLMLDIVINHTSHKHEWALKAKAGDPKYQDYFYMYDDRVIPDEFERTLPEVFPESSPGNFTYVPECDKWVMTVFHKYQWDLNYTNPAVFVEMLDNVLFYANLGVDIVRIDAPAFIWKQIGTISMNLPQAHTLLRLIKQCETMATPGMAILGEAIVESREILKYFGTGVYTAKECDLAYNATHMALQLDMLATGDTRVMLAAQHDLLQKPYGTTWITYTRCHDDIGLGYDDYLIRNAGYDPYEHRSFIKDYYSGKYKDSPSIGALFSSNPRTGDARISGSLASLCGLEKTVKEKDKPGIDLSIKKILLMQAHSFFLGGIPMLFYGDEAGYTNDYSFLNDPGKSYDNRWMHRPVIDWKKNARTAKKGTIENKIFGATQKLLGIRKKLPVVADHKNITWLPPYNVHVAGYLRTYEGQRLYCIFNFGAETAYLSWDAFKEHGPAPITLYDHWTEKKNSVGDSGEYLVIAPYDFHLFEPETTSP